jgi:VanZ family protein
VIVAVAKTWQRRRGWGLDIAPSVVALGAMFWFGLTPLKALPGPQFELVDKVWHLVAFGGLAGLLARAFAHFGSQPAAAARSAAATAVALGGLIEVLQSFTPYRSADWADLAADALGAVLAYAALRGLAAAAKRGVA